MRIISYFLLFILTCFSCTHITFVNHNQTTYNNLNEKRDFDSITLIKTNQEGIRYLLETLEPEAPDSCQLREQDLRE